MVFRTVTSSGFWSVTLPGFCARANLSFAIWSIGVPPIVASRKLPADCAFGAVAAPAVPPPAVTMAAAVNAAAVAHAASGTQRPRRIRPNADEPRVVLLLLTVIDASQSYRVVEPAA